MVIRFIKRLVVIVASVGVVSVIVASVVVVRGGLGIMSFTNGIHTVPRTLNGSRITK